MSERQAAPAGGAGGGMDTRPTVTAKEWRALAREINALQALVDAQDRLLAAYRLQDMRRGAAASDAVSKARERLAKIRGVA